MFGAVMGKRAVLLIRKIEIIRWTDADCGLVMILVDRSATYAGKEAL